MEPEPRSILVTGASGFVGAHLLPALAAMFPRAAIHLPKFAVQDMKQVEDAVRAVSPDSCIHLAAVSAVASAEAFPEHTWQVNFHGTLNLAWALTRHAPDCQLVFVSSADSYGASFKSGLPLTEQAPLAPMNLYAETKAAADFLLGGMAGQGLRVVRLRPFNHTGRGQSTKFVVPALALQIARVAAGLQEPVLNVGDIDTWRDFSDVRDICAAYAACVRHRHRLLPGTVLNLASGTARRVGDVLTELAGLAGVRVEVRVDPSRVRRNEIPMACGDASQARNVLGWQTEIPWIQTLQDVLDDCRLQVAATG